MVRSIDGNETLIADGSWKPRNVFLQPRMCIFFFFFFFLPRMNTNGHEFGRLRRLPAGFNRMRTDGRLRRRRMPTAFTSPPQEQLSLREGGVSLIPHRVNKRPLIFRHRRHRMPAAFSMCSAGIYPCVHCIERKTLPVGKAYVIVRRCVT